MDSRRGKETETHFRVLQTRADVNLGQLALVEAKPITGRTHQIRVHLAHIEHPVVGDPVYGGRGKKQLRDLQSQRSLREALLQCMQRQALHASELRFSHPVTGENLAFTRPVPEDFARALEMLRNKRQSNPPKKHGNIPL